MIAQSRIELPMQRIEEFCRRHGIAELALFGSPSLHPSSFPHFPSRAEDCSGLRTGMTPALTKPAQCRQAGITQPQHQHLFILQG